MMTNPGMPSYASDLKRTYPGAFNQPQAYRGYLITPMLIAGFVVTRDGHIICRPATIDEAKRQIEEMRNANTSHVAEQIAAREINWRDYPDYDEMVANAPDEYKPHVAEQIAALNGSLEYDAWVIRWRGDDGLRADRLWSFETAEELARERVMGFVR